MAEEGMILPVAIKKFVVFISIFQLKPRKTMMNVTLANFETEVIAASQTVPILVDFWAPWCGPCKVIGPLLEKLEIAYTGRFKLVKIDSDQEPQLAGAFGIRSIPTCILLINGQPVDGFAGALPEGEIKAFLDKHVPPADESTAMNDDPVFMQADMSLEAQMERLQHDLATDPTDATARFQYVKLLLQLGRVDDAKVAFAPVIHQHTTNANFAALQMWMDAIDTRIAPNAPSLDALNASIVANKRDFAARFARAQTLMVDQHWTEAMDELLEILMRDKTWGEERARKTYIAILTLMEPPKAKVELGQIPPEDATVATYRRRLSSVVLS